MVMLHYLRPLSQGLQWGILCWSWSMLCFEWLCLTNPGVPRYWRELLTRKLGPQFSSSKGLNTVNSCMGTLLMFTWSLWCPEQREVSSAVCKLLSNSEERDLCCWVWVHWRCFFEEVKQNECGGFESLGCEGREGDLVRALAAEHTGIWFFEKRSQIVEVREWRSSRRQVWRLWEEELSKSWRCRNAEVTVNLLRVNIYMWGMRGEGYRRPAFPRNHPYTNN